MGGGALRRAGELAALPAYRYLLTRATKRGSKIQDWIDVASNLRLGPLDIAPSILPTELAALLAAVSELRAGAALQLGAGRGGELYLLCRVLAPTARIITVDPAGPGWRAPLFRSFRAEGQEVHHLPSGPSSAREVERLLAGRPLDLLLIDGVHASASVERDLEAHRRLVRTGGLIALHPICHGPPQVVGEVPRLWEELRRSCAHRELVHDRAQGGGGVGLIHVGR